MEPLRVCRGGSVSFQGTPDFDAAIRVFDDVVRLQSGELVHGQWKATADDQVSLCGIPPAEDMGEDENPPVPRAARLIGRVRVMAPQLVPPRLSIVDRDANLSAFEHEVPCRAASAVGPTLILPDGTRREFRWSEISAFIPAPDLLDRRASPEAAVAAAVPQQPADTVRRVQEALATREPFNGPADGWPGTATTAAILRFQQARNEAPNGRLSPVQRRALAVR